MINIDDVRREHADAVIGPLLIDMIATTVRLTAPSYPPQEYSPSGAWDTAAVDDLTQEWVMIRLVERGDIGLLVCAARDLPALQAMLKRSLRQHMINRRRRTSATNLYSRMIKMLRQDPSFICVTPFASDTGQVWTLADMPATSSAEFDVVTRLIKAAYSRSDAEWGVAKYGPYSLKSSPILREAGLHSFLTYTMAEAGCPLTAADLFQVLRHRFNLIDLQQAELDELHEDPQPSVSSRVEARVLAQTVLAQLGDSVAAVRALDEADDDLALAAQNLDVTPAAIAEAREHLQALIAEYAESEEEARSIYRALIESLYGDNETYD